MSVSEEYPYLWAVVPPPEITGRIEALRQEFAANFQCFKALKPPVHLTLYVPVKLSDDDVEEQSGKLRKWIAAQPPFTLELKNFGFFETRKSPVVFVDVVPSAELKALNTGITRETKKLFELFDPGRQTFHPHFTIGYRDILPEIFPQVKQAYNRRLFSATFNVTQVCLFRHNRQRWELRQQFPLSTPENPQPGLW